MMASRVEYSIRSDWDLFPAIRSLNFASEGNTMASMGLQRCLRRGAGAVNGMMDRDTNVATGRLYELLLKGEYEADGKRCKINGDINKLPFAIGLDEKNFTFQLPFHVRDAGRDAADPTSHAICSLQQPGCVRRSCVYNVCA